VIDICHWKEKERERERERAVMFGRVDGLMIDELVRL